MPVIFGCILILIILIRLKTKSTDPGEMTIREFLKRDMEANVARKKDISGLPYLTADTSRLPELSGCADPEGEIRAALKTLRAYNGKQLLNLSGISNTDLKLAYGAANFPFLAACDADYTAFTRGLYRLGQLLAEYGEKELAVQTLLYAVELKTDIISTYRLLASIYVEQGNDAAIGTLRSKAEVLPDATRDAVLKILDSYTIL